MINNRENELSKENSNPDNEMLVELLLADYIERVEAGEHPDLNQYLELYPRIKDELAEAVAFYWLEIKELKQEQLQKEASTGEIFSRVNDPAEQARVTQLLNLTETVVPQTAITGLYKVMVQKKLKPPQVAKELNITSDILAALDRRMVRPQNLPRKLLIGLAEKLEITMAQITRYLEGQALASANYMAEDKPEAPRQETFAHLVKISQSLSDEQKSYWLKEVETDTLS